MIFKKSINLKIIAFCFGHYIQAPVQFIPYYITNKKRNAFTVHSIYQFPLQYIIKKKKKKKKKKHLST